jgi:hypothetical protein
VVCGKNRYASLIIKEALLNETFLKTLRRTRPFLYLLLAFLTGCFFAGLFFNRPGSGAIGKLDKRYYSQHRGATETVGRLEAELERERELNRQLREHNNRARELTDELAGTAERNVRNLQEAIGFIGEIRTKLKVLADFYTSSDTSNGGH